MRYAAKELQDDVARTTCGSLLRVCINLSRPVTVPPEDNSQCLHGAKPTSTEHMSSPAPTRPDRNAAIDALRGYAAFAVLIFHAREILWVGISEWLRASSLSWWDIDVTLGFLSLPFRYGWWGVPLFFVISGYCIHRPEIRRRGAEIQKNLNLRMYAAKRAWRIYPVLIAAMLVTAGLNYLTQDTSGHQVDISLSCFIANLAGLENIIAPTYGNNYALWTLAIEMQFYIAYPIYFTLLMVCGARTSIALVLFISAGSWCCFEMTGVNQVMFIPYWFSWVLGAYIAEAEALTVNFPRRIFAALSIPCLFAGLSVDRWKSLCVSSTPVAYSLLAIPFSIIVVHAITRPNNWVWNNPVSRAATRIGLFSFSLYATHVPVLYAYRYLIQRGAKSTTFAAVIPGVIVALGIGYVVYLLVERWTLMTPRRRGRDLQQYR